MIWAKLKLLLLFHLISSPPHLNNDDDDDGHHHSKNNRAAARPVKMFVEILNIVLDWVLKKPIICPIPCLIRLIINIERETKWYKEGILIIAIFF